MKKILTVILAVCMITLSSGCENIDKIKQSILELLEATEETEIENVPEAEQENNISVGVLDFDTFNPLVTKSETVRETMQFVFEPLFELDGEMRAVPVLASDYGLSADGRTININLKSGILWHDGSEFNAYDAAYTIRQIKNGVTEYTSALENVIDYTATGDYSLQITLNQSVPNFVAMLTFPIVKYQTPMSVNSAYMPVGTGPFKFDGRLSSDKMQMSAFDGYHEGRAKIDTVRVMFIPDIDKYRSMFEANEINIITSAMVDLTEYTPKGGATINRFVTNRFTFLGYNLTNSKLAGNETRMGLAELISRDDIVSSVIYSHGTAAKIPINPSSYLYTEDKSVSGSDEILAADHLGNDGWGTDMNGNYVRFLGNTREKLEFKILTNSESTEKTGVAEKIADAFNKFGIDTVVDAVPYDKYIQRIEAKDFDMFVGEMEMPSNLDPSALVSSSWNYFSYQNGDVDMLIAQLGMVADEEEQKLLFGQFAEIMKTDMPFVPLYYREGCLLSSSSIKSGPEPSVSAFYRSGEQWSVLE